MINHLFPPTLLQEGYDVNQSAGNLTIKAWFETENIPVKNPYLETPSLSHTLHLWFAQFVTHALLLSLFKISLYERQYSVFFELNKRDNRNADSEGLL